MIRGKRAFLLGVGVVLLSYIVGGGKEFVERAGMRVARDVSRYRSRKRIYGGNPSALVLLGRDDSASFLKERMERERREEKGIHMTREELLSYDGTVQEGGERMPIYLSVKGRIYDVSEGNSFYGEEGRYHSLVGKDSTLKLAKGCLFCEEEEEEGEEEEKEETWRKGKKKEKKEKKRMSEEEEREADRWLELFELHDKYKFVGTLV